MDDILCIRYTERKKMTATNAEKRTESGKHSKYLCNNKNSNLNWEKLKWNTTHTMETYCN